MPFARLGLTLLCATTLCAQPAVQTSTADSAALSLVIFEAAVANGTKTSYAAPRPRLVCVGQDGAASIDPPAAVITHLARMDSLIVRPASACRTELLGVSKMGTSLMIDTLTGQRGIAVFASEPMVASDGSFTVNLRYYEHGLSAAYWGCTGRRRQAGWEMVKCEMTSIS